MARASCNSVFTQGSLYCRQRSIEFCPDLSHGHPGGVPFDGEIDLISRHWQASALHPGRYQQLADRCGVEVIGIPKLPDACTVLVVPGELSELFQAEPGFDPVDPWPDPRLASALGRMGHCVEDPRGVR
jgi:hypothetical protein